MKIRRYLANNAQEAILKVKMDLGSEALILSSRKVKKKGLAGLFSKPMIEVLAAVDEYGAARSEKKTAWQDGKDAQAAQEAQSAGSGRAAGDNKIYFDEKEEKIANLENKIIKMEETLQKLYVQLGPGEKAGGRPDVTVAAGPAGSAFAQDGAGAAGTAQGASSRRAGMASTAGAASAPQGMPGVVPVAAGTSQAAASVSRNKSAAAEAFYINLVKKEVDPEIARKIVNTAVARIGENPGTSEIAARIYGIISGLLGKPETIRPGETGKPTVAMFVGPTGVGKTTTLAKIAANYLLNQRKTIGLITADTYRIAAVEQLKTYAEILGIPITVAYTPVELREAVEQYSDKDMILIDTAGRSHKNRAQLEELRALVAAAQADEIYLVLSATSSRSNCMEVLNSYDFLKNYKLIFTKTDETPVLGAILNVRYLTGKSLSYITNGQSVPDDIETADIDKITKNLTGSII